MSEHVKEIIARGDARVVAAPTAEAQCTPRHQVEVDRQFEMPSAFYGLTVGLYLAFIGVLFAGLSTPGLIIPMAIFAIFIIAGFGVPAIWTRLKDNPSKPLSIGKFQKAGIMTCTGRLAPRDAMIQMLLLPALIFLWSLVVITIAALV
ncbi:MAG: hypothetical protein AAF494_13890 [Pseudomonadota bacterium]